MQTMIEPQELLERLQDDSSMQTNQRALKVLFTTMNKAPAKKPDISKHRNADIPQSLLFDFETCFVDSSSALEHMMPPKALFETEAAKLDLLADDEIVIYDDFGNFCASRVWFMLIAMGYKHVKVLQGGLPAWLAHNYPVTVELDALTTSSLRVDVFPNRHIRFVDSDFVLATVYKKPGFEKIQIVDARSAGRFEGTEAEPRENMKSGHMPNALNLHYSNFLDEGYFKSEDELQQLFVEAGVDLDLPVVTACIVAQAFYELGKREIYVYDGSWSEWGAGETFPVERLKKDNS
jgi:thiosulfate/3-mercaptopyruvate sulfurtransferase